jgi:hypothetical protein
VRPVLRDQAGERDDHDQRQQAAQHRGEPRTAQRVSALIQVAP